MNTKVYRSITEPIRTEEMSWEQRWKGADRGLITSWEVGRELRQRNPELAASAEGGELPPLDWKGGVEIKESDEDKEKKKKKANPKRYGVYYYLAQWQGLRGEDLNIDLSKEVEMVCSRTNKKVIYTNDPAKNGGGTCL